MNLLALIEHPVSQALWDGAKYTAPKVLAAMREHVMAKPVTEADVQQAAAGTAEPDFSEQPTIQEVTS